MLSVKRQTAEDGVYDELVERIVWGVLRPGEHVVVARLAESLQVSPTPIRARKTEAYLRGKNPEDSTFLKTAKELLQVEISPRSRAEYRRKMAEHLFGEAIRVASKKILTQPVDENQKHGNRNQGQRNPV